MKNNTELMLVDELQREAKALASANPPKLTALERFKASIMDQTMEYPDPEPLMYLVQNGERFPHRTKKSFSLQQGKQKSKKTTELAIEAAAYIRTTAYLDSIYFECADPGVILFFDCEQGQSYAARTMKLILKLANLESSENLIYCDLREMTPKERLGVIEAAIEDTKQIKWVIIDGIVDIMDDFMSAEEGHLVITDLLRLCSRFDIHVTGVLHQNKGVSKDARAHVGSIAGQKCEIEVMVERDPDDSTMSIVSAKESRGLPFEDFAIKWEKGGMPFIVQDWSQHENSYSLKQKLPMPSEIDDSVHKKLIASTFYNQPEKMIRSEIRVSAKGALSEWQGFDVGVNKQHDWVNYWLKYTYIKQEGTTGTKSCKFSIK
jgi:SepF-like predicted cell division protein (DUF552 family)